MFCCKKCLTYQTQRFIIIFVSVLNTRFCIKINKGRKLNNKRGPGRSEKTEGIIRGKLHELETGNTMSKLPRDNKEAYEAFDL